jgi:uncharacterized protein (DUF58 family)
LLTTEEILKKVRALEIKSKRLTNHLFTGEYHSAFKGQGMSYKEVREYQPGDDIRFIDWNVSARYAHPYVKVFEEERELSLFLLIDNSASISFGSHLQRKKDLVTEIAAVLAFSAVNNNDKVGAILFGDKVQKFIAPKKAKQHTLFIVREMLGNDAVSKKTNYSDAFRMFNNVCRRKSICFIISDFLGAGFEDALRVAARKHDVIGIKVYDMLDMKLPDAGLIQAADAETGKTKWIDTSDPLVRFEYEKDFHRHSDYVKNVFKKAGADLLYMRAGEDYVKVLQKFFINRSK